MGGEGVPEGDEEDELTHLRSENQELKEKCKLQEMTDIADEHIAGRSDLKRSMTQMQKLQQELGSQSQSHEETLEALRDEKQRTTALDKELTATRALVAEKT